MVPWVIQVASLWNFDFQHICLFLIYRLHTDTNTTVFVEQASPVKKCKLQERKQKSPIGSKSVDIVLDIISFLLLSQSGFTKLLTSVTATVTMTVRITNI